MRTREKLFLALPAAIMAMGSSVPLASAQVPIRRVTFFTSGVAFTERAGEVEGSATVTLSFRTGQVNDILKSLVLIDERGKVMPATLATRDPIGYTLGRFAVDVSGNLSQHELLEKLRGATATVTLADKQEVSGQIVGVEKGQILGADGKPVAVTLLTLFGAQGITTVRLDPERPIRLEDARLNQELKDALSTLASGTNDQRRAITLRFEGAGRRQVRVGYVTEAPLWKMSYRLVLGEKPYLQGWAMVENTSDEDWRDVSLSLVSGRPVSFIQDLYQPLYLPRPVIPPDIVASPYPQTHGADMEGRGEKKEAAAPPPAAKADAPAREALRRDAASSELRGAGAPAGGFGGGGAMAASVEAQATGEAPGELFEYRIETPVTLARQQAALIPVIAGEIGAEKLLLYNAQTGGKLAWNVVRITNNTKLHLKGGPVTLFDDGVYAGDARMEDVPPGDSRLISYAVDLTVEGEQQQAGGPTPEMSLTLRRGILTISRKERSETTYVLKSKAQAPKTVLVEHPFDPQFRLITPEKPEERTANLYRFRVTVPPGAAKSLKVVLERPLSSTVALLEASLDVLSVYANRKEISASMREALQQVVQRRRALQELQAQAAGREAEIKAITEDQDRMRKNMAALDKTSALYKRYVTELDQQETKMRALREETSKLRKQAAEADQQLRAYLDTLTLE